MFQTAKSLIAPAAMSLYALPALAHPGHGPESTIPGHIHSPIGWGLLVVAFVVAAGLVYALTGGRSRRR